MQGFCDITTSNDVVNAVEKEVLQVLADNGIQLEEGGTWEEVVRPAVVYNKSTFGDAFDIMKTDFIVYEMRDWVLDQGLVNDRTITFQVSYTKIVSEDNSQKFTCIESGEKSSEIISSVDSVKKM